MARALVACVAWLAGPALAACGHSDPPPLTGRAAVTTPPPRVAWRDRDIAITGLPAIAADGSSVIVAHRDSDGERGNPNLALIEKDRDDRALRRLEVITATEVDQLDAAAIARRFDAAMAWLDERHAAAHLVAMAHLALQPASDTAPAVATGPGIRVRWAPSQIAIDLAPSATAPGGPIARTTPPSWLVADRPMCPGCAEVCHVDAVLAGAEVDLARRVAVVDVAFRAPDACWEPGAEAHVVAW